MPPLSILLRDHRIRPCTPSQHPSADALTAKATQRKHLTPWPTGLTGVLAVTMGHVLGFALLLGMPG